MGNTMNDIQTVLMLYVWNLQRELSENMKQKIRAEYEAIGGSPDKALKSNYFLNIMIVIGALAILTSLLGN